VLQVSEESTKQRCVLMSAARTGPSKAQLRQLASHSVSATRKNASLEMVEPCRLPVQPTSVRLPSTNVKRRCVGQRGPTDASTAPASTTTSGVSSQPATARTTAAASHVVPGRPRPLTPVLDRI
jgi:hypothetical protein